MPISIGSAKQQAPPTVVALLLECHERIRRFIALARALGERGDLDPRQVPETCAEIARYFTEALPLHVRDEEESLRARLQSPELEQMSREHDAHRPALSRLMSTLAALAASPEDQATKLVLAELASDLEVAFLEHLDLEERSIFPAVDRLPADVQAAIMAEIRARRVLPSPP